VFLLHQHQQPLLKEFNRNTSALETLVPSFCNSNESREEEKINSISKRDGHHHKGLWTEEEKNDRHKRSKHAEEKESEKHA